MSMSLQEHKNTLVEYKKVKLPVDVINIIIDDYVDNRKVCTSCSARMSCDSIYICYYCNTTFLCYNCNYSSRPKCKSVAMTTFCHTYHSFPRGRNRKYINDNDD